jgi:hypothetical protein
MTRRLLSLRREAHPIQTSMFWIVITVVGWCGSQALAQTPEDQAAFSSYKQLCSQVHQGTWEMRTTLCAMLGGDEDIVKTMIGAQIQSVCSNIDRDCSPSNEQARDRLKFFASTLKCPSGSSICTKGTARQTTTLVVQAKSFIAPIHFLSDPSQADSCLQKVEAFAVDCVLLGGENPADGNLDSGNFRLLSQLNVEAQCDSNKIAKWRFFSPSTSSGPSTSFGKEAFFQTSGDLSKPLTTSPMPVGASTADRVDFNYRVRGHPIGPVNLTMALAKARTCTYIWHEVTGSLTCSNGSPHVNVVGFTGSMFPSHRLWINGEKVLDIPQKQFKNLWDCDLADPTSVR